MTDKVAWFVAFDDEEEPGCTVVFAHGEEEALRIGANQLQTEPESCWAQRQEQFDAFREKGWVPPKVLLAHGWTLACHGCEEHLDSESQGPVEVGRFIFCGNQCRDDLAVRVDTVNHIFQEFQADVRRRWPHLTYTGFDGGWPIVTPIARFTFPGALFGGGRIRLSQEGVLGVSVASGDLEAWERFQASRAEG